MERYRAILTLFFQALLNCLQPCPHFVSTGVSQIVPGGVNTISGGKTPSKSAIRMQGQIVSQNGGMKGKTYVVKFAETDENVNKVEHLCF